MYCQMCKWEFLIRKTLLCHVRSVSICVTPEFFFLLLLSLLFSWKSKLSGAVFHSLSWWAWGSPVYCAIVPWDRGWQLAQQPSSAMVNPSWMGSFLKERIFLSEEEWSLAKRSKDVHSHHVHSPCSITVKHYPSSYNPGNKFLFLCESLYLHTVSCSLWEIKLCIFRDTERHLYFPRHNLHFLKLPSAERSMVLAFVDIVVQLVQQCSAWLLFSSFFPLLYAHRKSSQQLCSVSVCLFVYVNNFTTVWYFHPSLHCNWIDKIVINDWVVHWEVLWLSLLVVWTTVLERQLLCVMHLAEFPEEGKLGKLLAVSDCSTPLAVLEPVV